VAHFHHGSALALPLEQLGLDLGEDGDGQGRTGAEVKARDMGILASVQLSRFDRADARVPDSF
jgi:hypothetical protein